jgi:hypothetical protein
VLSAVSLILLSDACLEEVIYRIDGGNAHAHAAGAVGKYVIHVEEDEETIHKLCWVLLV